MKSWRFAVSTTLLMLLVLWSGVAHAALPKPKAPTTLTAARISGSQVRLAWNDPATNEQGYEVQRSTKPGIGFKVTATLGANSTGYTDNTSSNYYYRVRAFTQGTTATKRFSTFSPVALATTSVPTAPSITTQPTSQTVFQGQTAMFSVVASGTAPLSYQWQKNGVNITGATAATYSRSAIKSDNGSQFRCVVSNVTGSATSNSATLLVPNQAPIANAGPDRSSLANTSLSLSGASSSDADGNIVSYLWQFGDGGSASGASVNHTYTSTGAFEVVLTVTDNDGATGTDSAIVTVSADSESWAQRFGSNGNGNDGGSATAVDANGDILVTGNFHGTVNFGGTSLVSVGLQDIFVAKYTAAGAHLWSRQFGGAGDDIVRGLAVDSNDDLVIVGEFSGAANFGGGLLTSIGVKDIFLVGLSGVNGGHRWSRRLESSEDEQGSAIAIDALNNIIITGFYRGTADFGSGTHNSTNNWVDIFVAKYTAQGQPLWSRVVSGGGREESHSVAVDAMGDVILTGYFNGHMDFGGGLLNYNMKADIFIAKLGGTNGSHIWSKSFGTANDDVAKAVAVDGSGNVLLTGYSRSTIDFGGGPLIPAGIFLVKLNAGGQHIWSRGFDGMSFSGVQEGRDIAVDANNNVIVTGLFVETANFGGGTVESLNYLSDVFVAKYTPSGSHLWSQRIGGTTGDYGSSVAVGNAGDVVIAGGQSGTGNYAGTPLTSAGGYDFLLMSLSPE